MSACSAADHATRIRKICRRGDDVVLHKDKLIETNRLHNSNREALGAIRRKEVRGHLLWVDMGGFFLKAPLSTVTEKLKGEQLHLETEREQQRREMKEACKRLIDLHPNVSEMSAETLRFLLDEGGDSAATGTGKTKTSEGKVSGGLQRGFLLKRE